jgi:hypothetical protein
MPNPDPDAVAYHFQQAGDAQAIAWLIKAGERALEVFADSAAIPQLEAALTLLDAQGRGGGERIRALTATAAAYRFIEPSRALIYVNEALRTTGEAHNRLFTMRALSLRGVLHTDAGRVAAGLADMLAARELLSTITDTERKDVQDAPYFAAATYSLDGALTEWLALCGEFARAREMGERLVANLPNIETGAAGLYWGTALALANCHFGLLIAYFYQGEPTRAIRAAALARSGYEHLNWGWMLSNTARMECLNALVYAADRPDEWRRLATEIDIHGASTVREHEGATPQPGRAMVLAAEGRWDEAREMTASMLNDLRLLHRQMARLVVAGIDRACGETEAAREAVRAVLPGDQRQSW